MGNGKRPAKRFVKAKGKVTEAEALAMGYALADALGIPKDEGEKPSTSAP